MDKKIEKIRVKILNSYEMNINDKFVDYDEIVDIVSDYHLEVSSLFKSYDKYVESLVNEDISKDEILSINLEITNRLIKEYSVDIKNNDIDSDLLLMFDEAMYQVINDDNQLSIKQVFDMIDYWTRELDMYISNINK